MGLAARVVVTLLVRGDRLVKGRQFQSWRSVGSAMQGVRVQNQRSVDELVILDIAATPERRGPNLELIRKLTDECYCPVTVGGGVRSVEDVRDLLCAGADKVSCGTAACRRPAFVTECAEKFGSQAIVVSIDYSMRVKDREQGVVMDQCGTHATSLPPKFAAKMFAECGAGEILLTSIDREGTMEGYDLDMIREVSAAVKVPVVAHGGCSGYANMVEAVEAGASAVAAGALFQFSDCTPRGASLYLQEHGHEARIS